MKRSNLEQFQSDPARFLETMIKKFVANSSSNRLPSFDNESIFDEPLVGFADGDDAIFQEYKTIIGDFHFTPREALELYIKDKEDREVKRPTNVSVISFVLPITNETRLSLRREFQVASLRWNHTRWQGEDHINELAQYLVSLLEKFGYHAVAPGTASFFDVKRLPNGLASNWSQRHIAYAAGLGTFSLSDGLITSKGIAMRCGSVVTDLPLPPTPRLYQNHLANCLFYGDGSCRRCIERCPAGAISEQGHDKNRCSEFMNVEQRNILNELGRGEGYIGRYVGCGLCQTKVPCEAGIPREASTENK